MRSASMLSVVAAVVACFAVVPAHASSVQVTVGTSPAGASFTVDGTTYSSAQTFTWTVGASHSISVTSPQVSSTTEYTYSSWSDGGAMSHTVTASSSVTSYTASFSTSYELTIGANNTHGSTSPATGNFYAAGSTVAIQATPASGYYLSNWTGSSDIANTSATSTTVTMNGAENITANFKKSGLNIQYIAVVYTVTTAADDAEGTAANCPLGGPFNGTGLNCSLRDALEAAKEAGGANIYFDATTFASTNTAAQNTISLTYGQLSIPSRTVVSAPTVQSGNSLANLVTVNGGNASTVFWVAQGTIQADIKNLNITGGSNSFGGGGIYDDGELTLIGCSISGNSAPGGEGGGIYIDSDGTLEMEESTASGNSADTGGGIANYGNLILLESTLSGNQATTLAGGLYDAGTAAVFSSTIAANQATGSGTAGGVSVMPGEFLKLANSIVGGNTSPGLVPPDLQGDYTDNGGNFVNIDVNLAALGNYGGPTLTQIPLPWSPAICGGLQANVLSTEFSDQRGFANTNATYPGYSVASPCIDSGAVQTAYSLAFTGQPMPVAPDTSIRANTNFTAAVTLSENGTPFSVAVTIPLSLTGSGSLAGGSATTSSAGVASYSGLQVSATGTGDVLMASLALDPPNSPNPLQIAAATDPFDVVTLATTTTATSVSVPFSGGAQSAALSAQVVTSSDTVNAGTVRFSVMAGSNVVGTPVTAFVSNGGAEANYVLPAALTPGVYTINAAYDAAGGFSDSSDATQTLTVAQAMTSVALTSSSGTSNLNASVTFTAVVTGTAAVAPTGTVAFMDGSDSLGTGQLDASGAASLSVTTLTAGSHSITAVYAGDADFAGSTSGALTQTVVAPSYTLTADSTGISVVAGQSGTATFKMTPVGGFNGSVSFACSNLPAHVSCSFSPASLTADGSNTAQTTTLTVSTSGTSAMAALSHGDVLSGREEAAIPLIPCLVCGILIAWRRKRFLRYVSWMMLLVAAAAMTLLSGCAGSSSKAAAGTYTVAVTGTASGGSSTTTQSIAFTVTVTK